MKKLLLIIAACFLSSCIQDTYSFANWRNANGCYPVKFKATKPVKRHPSN